MKNLLFPHKCKVVGIVLLLIGIAVLVTNEYGYLDEILVIGKKDFTFTAICTLWTVGGLLTAFSKEKIEDEFITHLRLSSLIWAIFINYILLLACILFIYGIDFVNVMVYSMFTPLIIFIIRFNLLYYKYSRRMANDK